MSGQFLIYGATGYTGERIARAAAKSGLTPILAGRRPKALQRLAGELGTAHRVFALNNAKDVEKGLADVAVVLHCAGPFVNTSRAMADACITTGVHYMDISGEVDVFEALRARDEEAKRKSVMLMPGVGFDVVPSDCLAAHVKRRLPSATRLAMAVRVEGSGFSRGTLKTIARHFPNGAKVRRNGRLKDVPLGWKTRHFPDGNEFVTAASVPLADLTAAYHSTGIPNIDVYMVAPAPALWAMKAAGPFTRLMGCKPAQRVLRTLIDRRSRGPASSELSRGRATLWAEARDEAGQRVLSRLETPEGYTLTVLTALALVEKATQGQGIVTPGFHTAGSMYSSDFVTKFPGTKLSEIY
jgi:short subunit dehydrogenase-like uncharacterized protein